MKYKTRDEAQAHLVTLKEKLNTSNDGLRTMMDEMKTIDERVKVLREAIRIEEQNSRALRNGVKRAEHIAAGKCADTIRRGSGWHTYDEACEKNAKPGEIYCGTHLAARKRRESNPPFVLPSQPKEAHRRKLDIE